MNHERTLAYMKETKSLGLMKGIDYLKNEIVVENYVGDITTHSLNDVVILQVVAETEDGSRILNYDIFHNPTSDALYELEYIGNGTLQFHVLDKEYNRVDKVDKVAIPEFLKYIDTYDLIGNRYELLAEDAEEAKTEFNVKIIKKADADGDFHYYYACSNKEEDLVDLIKVVFIGATLLEQPYQRISLELEEYLEYVQAGTFIDVSPQELQQYAFTLMKGNAPKTSEPSAPADFDSEDSEEYEICDCGDEDCDFDCEEEDICDRCGQDEDDCDCELY